MVSILPPIPPQPSDPQPPGPDDDPDDDPNDDPEDDPDDDYEDEWEMPRDPMLKPRNLRRPPEVNKRTREPPTPISRFISAMRKRMWLPMAAMLTASSVAYIAYAERVPAQAISATMERFRGDRQIDQYSDSVQAALARAIHALENGHPSPESLAEVLAEAHAALQSRYARHADIKVAVSCGAVAVFLLGH